MGRVQSAVSVAMIATVVALGVSIVTTVAVLLASLAGWLLSRYLPFTPFEATGLWLLAGSVVTLAAAGLFAAFMASGTQQAQRELLERLSQDADEEDEEDEEARALVFVTPTPRKAVPRRVLAKARRSR